MAATDRETDDRWQMALELGRENSQRYQDLVRIVQSGFGSLGTEVGAVTREVGRQAKDIAALQMAQNDCQQRLIKLEAESSGRKSVLHWLLLLNMANAIGWLAVVGLLVWLVMRLFSLTG